MANPEHLKQVKEHHDTWNEWRKGNPFIVPDLSGANLIWANLSNLDLSGADLRGAQLARTDLTDTALRGATLRETELAGAYFINADLRGADLSGAVLFKTTFAMARLNGTRGMTSCIHKGPSSIGIDTFFQSNGEIPEIFLRGCGVPEQFIVQMNALIGSVKPIQFYSCFISHSSRDQELAERLHADLQQRGLRIWYAPEDLKIGDRFQERIEESIRVYDKVMIVLSEASVQSRWVEREVNAAGERENRENRTVLFPIRIDDAVMNAPQPWAADIRRSRHMGDFRDWKHHDSYQKALGRLLRDLKAEEGPVTSKS